MSPTAHPTAHAQAPPFTVIFEGGEAAGKTSQVAHLVASLRTSGRDVYTSGVFLTPHGQIVRDWLMDADRFDRATLRSQLFVLGSAMNQVLEEVTESGASVAVLDRFVYTTMAYHGGGLSMGVAAVEEVYAPVLSRLTPDLVIFLDLPPEEITRRKPPRDWVEAGTMDFHSRVRQTYCSLAARLPNFVTVDAMATEPAIANQILAEVLRRLPD